ncbi:MAG: DUF4097 family beta strand repeat protein [Chloroflexi bacterium]|nr:DUF5668 domain-containing protein [Anaerolineaceae bacterium]NMB89783.1 DUF4097 family beta strand repeat protein [Chloroflexota bacterium]
MHSRQYRSMFWPILLIGVGVVWLLYNLGMIAPVNINMILRLWPVLLIAIGLDIIFGRQSPLLGALIGLLAVAFLAALLLFGTTWGFIHSTPQVVTEQMIERTGNATSASVSLELSEFPSDIHAAAGSGTLIDAEITHYDDVELEVTPGDHKRVRLVHHTDAGQWLWSNYDPSARWDIALTGEIPLDLSIDGASGSVHADLSDLQLSSLAVDTASGSLTLTLPQSERMYTANLSSGSGSIHVTLPCNVEVHLNSGSGSQDLDVPQDCPARVEVRNGGSGSLHLSGMHKVEYGRDEDEGAWETEDFNQDGPYVHIVVEDHGSGSLNVR